MNKNERFKLIQNANQKLELIKEMRSSFEYIDENANHYIYCNFNFSDVYEYFKKTFELLDIETEKDISFKDSFFRLFGLLQIIYVQQDLLDAIAKVFGVNVENGTNRKINRDLRDELIGHPLSDERDSKKRNNSALKIDARKIKSTIILRDFTPNTFHYTSYEPNNTEEQYFDKMVDVDLVLIRHITFLNESLELVLSKCFEELQRQVSKIEGYVKNYQNVRLPEVKKFDLWFKSFFNHTFFNFETLSCCFLNKDKHKKYEVYLVEFKRMIFVYYLETIVRYNEFDKKIHRLTGRKDNCIYSKSIYESLKCEVVNLRAYFPTTENFEITHDLRDISTPDNNSWDIGFNQLNRVFINDSKVIEELNILKSLRSNPLEYEISYRYIEYLVGYC